MGSIEKAKQDLLKCSKNYTYNELKSLLQKLGFEEHNKGKTSGSRVMFYRKRDERILMLHKPHPENTVDQGALKDLIKNLKEYGDL